MNGGALGLEVLADGDAEEGYFTDNDLNAHWQELGAESIELTGDGAAASGGAYFMDGVLHIVSPGRYILTGSLAGSVTVELEEDGKVWLGLDGVTIESPDGPAVLVEQAEKVFLTLFEGTENRLASRAFTDASSGADGAVYSRDDLTVNGSGALTVESAGHGVVCNDDLVLTGGKISVTAREDGLHANDSVRICASDITVTAGDDGVTVSNEEGTGYFYMESGSLTIPACFEGVEGQQIALAGGEVDIIPTDDGLNARETWSDIAVTGGSLRVVNAQGRDADGIDSNGSIHISGGYVFISVSDSGGSAALDAGTESGGACVVSGGTVVAAGSGTMAESFDASSPQGFLTVSTRGEAGTRVELSDAEGNLLMDEEIPCAFLNLTLSCPQMTVGDTVTLSVGGAEQVLTVTNASGSGFGGMGGFFGGGGRVDGQTRPGMPQDGGTTAPEGDTGEMTPPNGNFGGMTLPEGGFDRGNRGEGRLPTGGWGNLTGDSAGDTGSSGTEENAADPGTLIMTLVSALVLAAGIAVAVKIRH